MGLDMYLELEVYIGAEYEHRNIKGKVNLTQGKDNSLIELPPLNTLSSINYRVAYWRKANAIHNWITKGSDDDRETEISGKKLLELVEICKKVKKSLVDGGMHDIEVEGYNKAKSTISVYKNTNLAEELLPTTSGFFFGDTNYNEWYIEDLNSTI